MKNDWMKAPTGEEKVKRIENEAFWLTDGTEVEYTSPYYPEIWVKGVVGEDVFLKGQMNSGHGMNWDAEKHFVNEDGTLKNIRRIYGRP